MILSDFAPLWLLTYFVIGWLLGLLAVRDWKWAMLCGLTTTLGTALGLNQTMPFPSPWPMLTTMLLGFLLLWGISRLPEQRLRIVLAALLVPVVTWWLLQTGVLLFFIIFQIS